MLIGGNIKWGSITVPLSSCLTGLDWSVLHIKTTIVSCHTTDSKPVKQEVNSTVILPLLLLPAYWGLVLATGHWKEYKTQNKNFTHNDNSCNNNYQLH